MKRNLIDSLAFFLLVFGEPPVVGQSQKQVGEACIAIENIFRIFQSVLIQNSSVCDYVLMHLYSFCQPPGIPMTGFLRMLGQRNKKKSESRSSQQQAELLNPMEGILQGISSFAWNSNFDSLT